MHQPTYDDLFSFLNSIHFQDSSNSDYERVFKREDLDVVLVFSMLANPVTDRLVRDADLLSTETRLVHHGLVAPGSLVKTTSGIKKKPVNGSDHRAGTLLFVVTRKCQFGSIQHRQTVAGRKRADLLLHDFDSIVDGYAIDAA